MSSQNVAAGGVLAFCALVGAGRATAAETPTLSLTDALTAAQANNPSLQAARETAAAAGYKVNQVRAAYLPQVNATASYMRLTTNMTPQQSASFGSLMSMLAAILAQSGGGGGGFRSPGSSNDSINSFTATLSVNQVLYDFGRTGGAYDAARADASAAAADADTTHDVVYLTVTQTYFAVLASQELQQAALETKKQMEKHLELAQAQVDAGARPMIDVTRARADVANANLTVLHAKNLLAIAKSGLNAVMGVTEAASDYRVERPAAENPPALQSMEGAVRTALEKRPEYRGLKSRVDSMRSLVTVAHAGYLPTLGASGNLTYTGEKPSDLAYNWVVGATLTWNLFSGLATTNAVDELEARTRSLEATLRSSEIVVRNDVETAYLAFEEAVEKLAPTQALLDAATETLTLAEGRYQAGAGGIVEVADAQALLIQARTTDIAAKFDLEVARTRLLKSLGMIPSQS